MLMSSSLFLAYPLPLIQVSKWWAKAVKFGFKSWIKKKKKKEQTQVDASKMHP